MSIPCTVMTLSGAKMVSERILDKVVKFIKQVEMQVKIFEKKYNKFWV